VFGSGDEPLFLVGTAGQEATAVHGNHFIPASSQANGLLTSFFNASIGYNVASFPLSSAVASQTFKFVDGVPTPTSNSFGPIFAERAQTVGRGRLNAGLNYSRLRFSDIRGVDHNDIALTFVQVWDCRERLLLRRANETAWPGRLHQRYRPLPSRRRRGRRSARRW